MSYNMQRSATCGRHKKPRVGGRSLGGVLFFRDPYGIGKSGVKNRRNKDRAKGEKAILRLALQSRVLKKREAKALPQIGWDTNSSTSSLSTGFSCLPSAATCPRGRGRSRRRAGSKETSSPSCRTKPVLSVIWYLIFSAEMCQKGGGGGERASSSSRGLKNWKEPPQTRV